jgi:exodeoxyribonuclease VII large subunit
MSDLFNQPFEDEPPPDTSVEKPKPASRRKIVTVSELTASLRAVIEGHFGDIWVEGEISNCRVWHTGHMYFTLKDDTAQIRAVMFRSASHYLRFKPEDGLHVVARGKLGVYDAKGEYQIVCEHLEPKGIGALQLAFEQLKKRLQAEGLFKPERKRPLPALPRKIGIVTSLDGAALRDIITVLRRRHANAHIVIRPARVQGENAATEIVRALRAIVNVPGMDVIIVGRGGGSAEDLQAFNEEVLARAIVASPVPIISAVGHEVDFTIADFVADFRAPTPSAAAEVILSARDDCRARMTSLRQSLDAAIRKQLQRRRNAAHLLRLSLEARDVARRLAAIRGRLTAADGRLGAAVRRVRDRADTRFRVLVGRLENLSPLAILARGYAVCWNEDRTAIISRADAVNTGDRVRVTLHQGELQCDVVRKVD